MGTEIIARMEATKDDNKSRASSNKVDLRLRACGGMSLDGESGGPHSVEGIRKGL